MDFDYLQEDQQDMTSREIKLQEQIKVQQIELEKTKSRMQQLTTAVEDQAEKMNIMISTLEKIPKVELRKYI